MAKNKGKNDRSAVNIIEGIVIGVLILLIAVMLFLYFSFSKKGAAPEIFGYTFYHTMAKNMETDIPANTLIFAKKSEIENIKAGSVVLCRLGEDTILTRVVELNNDDGELSYVVKFDTAPPNDTFKIPRENIIAKAVTQSSIMGSVLSFATSTFGIMLVIIIPSFVIIVFQTVRIVNAKRREEEASSLEDLDEIMISDDDRFEEMFGEEPDTRPEPERVVRQVRQSNLNPIPREDEKPKVLSVDKNGRAGLTAVPDGGAPLFTYESYRGGVKKQAEDGSQARQGQTVRLEKEEREEEETTNSAFMSNVIPEPIVSAVSDAENAGSAAQPAEQQGERRAVHVDKVIRKAPAIPPQAALPREKIAPPPKRNNSRAISELMSIIDAEESKLKK
ncbi:MAG: signal peptidase I [Ruminococcus sp.]|nr:signal peptidase I [Ruminococcus sp.]